MNFVDSVLKRIFGQPESISKTENRILHREVLKRTPLFLAQYQKFESETLFTLLNQIRSELKKDVQENPLATWHTFQGGSGLLLQGLLQETTNGDFLMHYFSNQLTKLSYLMQHSERVFTERNQTIIQTDTLYLKPKPTAQDQNQLDQQYGNVSLTFSVVDNTPNWLKIQMNTYSDRSYTQALPGRNLISILLHE